jgi:hypothetical protein
VRPSTGALRAPAQDEVISFWHAQLMPNWVGPHPERAPLGAQSKEATPAMQPALS